MNLNDWWQFGFVLIVMAVLAEAVVILALARAIGLIQLQLGPMPGPLATSDGLPLGTAPPAIRGELADGQSFVWSPDTGAGDAILLFITPTCGACREALRAAALLSADRGLNVAIVAISFGLRDQNAILAQAAPRIPLVHDEAGAVHSEFRIARTPVAMLVRDGRLVNKGVANTRDQLEGLLEGQRHVTPQPLWVESQE